MLRLASLFLILASTAFASAQSLPDYLRMRKQHAVTQPNEGALDAVIGSRVIEIRGVVKGSFRVGDRMSIMFERADGQPQIVEALAVPDWLLGNEVPARLLVRVTRAEAHSSLRVALIGAAMEGDLRKVEEEAARKAAALAAAKRAKPTTVAKASARTKGSAPLYGSITRSGTRLTSRGGATRRNMSLPASEVTPIYAAFVKKFNPRLPNSEALRIAQAVVGFSIRYEVDARLVMAILLVESNFDPNSVSRSGAMGLGQLMPGTAKWMGVGDPFDTTQNLYGSIKLLRTHLDKYRRQTGNEFDSIVLSLAAYNAGEGAVRRHGGVPPYRETQRYVRKVYGWYKALAGM